MSQLITPGEPAPDFELEDIHSQRLKLSNYRDNKIIILYFLRGFM